jgi:hypothetical protein
MIILKLGRWNNAAIGKYCYQRIYRKGYKWTPFVKRTKRLRKVEDLTSHERAIASMYLSKARTHLIERLDSRQGEDNWTTEHDIQILDNAIKYLEQ